MDGTPAIGNDAAPNTERIEFVQALRGIAALAVVMFHARIWIAGPAFMDAGPRLFENGAAGVDLFFIVSCFIMVHTTWHAAGGVRSAARFLAKRVARIWPVYVITTFGVLIAEGTIVQWTTTYKGVAMLGKAFVFYPSKHGPPFFGWTPNGVGWTLNFEIWFYVLFAIALLAGSRRWLVLIGLFLLFLVAVPLASVGTWNLDAYFSYDMSPAILNLLGNSMVWEFLAGVAIGVLYRSRFRIRNRELLGAFVVLSITAVVWQQLSQDHARQGPTGWGLPLVVMMLALALWNKQFPIRVPRWLLWLGDLSFSLYLVHRIPQLGLPRLIPTADATLAGGVGFVLTTTVMSLVLAHFSFRYLEQGLSERVRVWLLRRVDARSA